MRGFSLAEVILSLGILAMAFVALMNLTGSAVKVSSKSENLAVATDLAEKEMTSALQKVLADEPPGSSEEFWENDWTEQPWREGTVKVNRMEFSYAIHAKTLQDTEGGELGESTPNNRVKKVDISVWWMTEEPGEGRTGYGELSVEATRLLNEVKPDEA
jgi:type II secretory pathway pseudopilin PulG